MYVLDEITVLGRRPAVARRLQPVDLATLDAAVLEQIVLRAFGLEAPSLRSPLRGRANVAFARQVAIYVLHVRIGVSLTRTARIFGRDRTTAAHAVRVVEDRRDDGRVDALVGLVETAMERWISACSRDRKPEALQ